MARKPQVIILHKEGYKFAFWLEGKGRQAEVMCQAYKVKKVKDVKIVYEDNPCLNWAFPKVAGNNLVGNSAIFLDQALMYAKNPPA